MKKRGGGGVSERKTALRYTLAADAALPAPSERGCEECASFSGSPLEKIPLTVLRHLVEAARSGASSKQRQCSGEQAAVCRSRLSGGLHQNLTWTPHPRRLGVRIRARD